MTVCGMASVPTPRFGDLLAEVKTVVSPCREYREGCDFLAGGKYESLECRGGLLGPGGPHPGSSTDPNSSMAFRRAVRRYP